MIFALGLAADHRRMLHAGNSVPSTVIKVLSPPYVRWRTEVWALAGDTPGLPMDGRHEPAIHLHHENPNECFMATTYRPATAYGSRPHECTARGRLCIDATGSHNKPCGCPRLD